MIIPYPNSRHINIRKPYNKKMVGMVNINAKTVLLIRESDVILFVSQ